MDSLKHLQADWRDIWRDVVRLDTQFYCALLAGLAIAIREDLPTWWGTLALAVFVLNLAIIFQHFAGKRYVGEVNWNGPWTPKIAVRLLIMGFVLYAAIRFI